jgi:hypothetical protein
MRRLIGPALLGLVCSCYLFSDEPKARKRADAGAAKQPAESAESGEPAAAPMPSAEIADCPEFLTGVEAQARTIASSCGPVRVRGQYRVDGGTLTLEAGVELRFEPGAVLEVGRDRPGTLTVAGTAEQPVRLVADSVDETGGWQGLRLHAHATGSSLKHLEIASAGTAERAALWIAASEVAIEGLAVRSPVGLALEIVDEARPALLGAELGGTGGGTGIVARATPSAVAGLQELQLETGARVAIAPGTITTTLEWPPNPYRVEGLVRVEGEEGLPAQLSLTPGTTLEFTSEGRILVGGLGPGSLSASAITGARPEPLPLPPEGVVTPPPPSPPPEAVPPGLEGAIRLRAARELGAEGEAVAEQEPLPGAWGGLLIQDQGQLMFRNVEIAHGGARDQGVIVAEGKATLTLEGCSLRANLVGIELRGVEVEIESFDRNDFVDTPVAIRTTPTLLGALGPDNRYDAGARILVERGKIQADTTWLPQGPPGGAPTISILGDVFVDEGATLSVAPGSRIGFGPGVVLGVGYYETATLDMRGTKEAPIVLEPLVPPPPSPGPQPAVPGGMAEPQPWGGIVLGAQARKSRFEHLKLRQTANDAGIELRDSADATLIAVDCAACVGATVAWDCASSIGNMGVTASEGTPKPMAAPANCK